MIWAVLYVEIVVFMLLFVCCGRFGKYLYKVIVIDVLFSIVFVK